MKRKLEVDVEPLSDARWKRIDEAIFAELGDPRMSSRPPAQDARSHLSASRAPGSRRPRWIMLAMGSAAAAAIVAAVLLGVGRDTHGPTANLSHIETGAKASSIALGFAQVEVGPETSVTTSGDEAHGVVVVLERGTVECEVAPRSGRPPFIVQSGDVRVRVVGTRFLVHRGAETSVEVKHGTVEVTQGGTQVAVHAGEAWPSSAPAPSSDRAPPPVETAPSPPPSDAAPPPPTSAGTASPKTAMSDQQVYEQAARLERKDPSEATRLYLSLANKSGPWSATSLFAAGRLATEQGRKSDAKRLLEQYLAKYPAGSNAEDARRLLGDLH